MCGIVGYVGSKPAAPIVLEGLKRLEYRGYDSAGMAYVRSDKLVVKQSAGKIRALEAKMNGAMPDVTVALGHTRWATHGAPTDVNAHPHADCSGEFAVVHNGIIENSALLKRQLIEKGHVFKSETDTEVLVHLIEDYYDGSLRDAVIRALENVEGTYGLGVVSSKEPGTLIAARNGSPLLLGIGEGENLFASDASAIVQHTKSVVYLDDGEVAEVTQDGYQIVDLDSVEVNKQVDTVEGDRDTIEKEGYPHFMLKEIFEQPRAIVDTMRGRLQEEEGTARLGGLNLNDKELQSINRIVLIACGTSWHAALIGEYMLEELSEMPTEVEYASEFRYRTPLVDENTLVIGISQSGETADTLAAIREAKARGARTLGIVNTVGSTIAREVDGGVYIHAGSEIGVASTKAFTCQVTALALLTLRFGRLRKLSVLQGREVVQALRKIPEQVSKILENAAAVEDLAERFSLAQHTLFLGRGYNFPVALEGALKLKEISYIHAEGYPAAEMKHGPIALIDHMMPVVCVAPQDAVYQKIVSNIQEVKARNGKVLAIVTEGDEDIAAIADYTFEIPETLDCLTPLLSVIPLQLLSYYVAVKRGCDVDQPRNLAKSVTVE